MKLYDNDEYRDEFMAIVYALLHSDGTNDRANQIIDAFDNAPAIDAEPIPSRAPLSLEELREMDGEPVFIVRLESDNPADRDWSLVDLKYDMCRTVTGGLAVFELYGKTWLAYRRKPEEASCT